MTQYRTDPTVSAIVQEIRAVGLLLLNDWHKEIGRENQNTPAESRRRYANDGERMIVQLNNTADHAAIILEMAVPIGVGEHDIGSAVWAMLIGWADHSAEVGLNP